MVMAILAILAIGQTDNRPKISHHHPSAIIININNTNIICLLYAFIIIYLHHLRTSLHHWRRRIMGWSFHFIIEESLHHHFDHHHSIVLTMGWCLDAVLQLMPWCYFANAKCCAVLLCNCQITCRAVLQLPNIYVNDQRLTRLCAAVTVLLSAVSQLPNVLQLHACSWIDDIIWIIWITRWRAHALQL